MIPDSFQIFGYHQHIHTGVDIVYAFLKHVNQIVLNLGKKGIHYVIMAYYLVCRITVSGYKGMDRIMDDFLRHLKHTGYMPGISIQITSLQPQKKFGNIRSLISDTLNIRYHLQGSRYHTQIPCNRLLPGYQGKAF